MDKQRKNVGAAALVSFAGISAVYIVARAVVTAIDSYPELKTVAIEECPLAFPYIADGIALERPAVKAVEVRGGTAMARAYRPCLYVWYTDTYPKSMYVDVIE